MTTTDPQKVMREAQEKGLIGQEVDQTPRENYSVAGVISGAPVPPVHPGQRKEK